MAAVAWRRVIGVLFVAFFVARPLAWAQAPDAPDAQGKPTLIMGAKYGVYEKQVIIGEILTPKEVTYDDGGEYMSAENWPHYSQVIVCNSAELLGTEQEYDWARAYVRGGGRLILVGTAMGSFRPLKKAEKEWVGAYGYHAGLSGEAKAVGAGHWASPGAQADGVLKAMQPAYYVTAVEGATPVVEIGERVAAFVNTFGQGEVVFVGREMFRIPEKDEQQKQAKAAYRQWLASLILHGQPLRRSELIEQSLREAGFDGPVAWYRDPGEQARGAAYFREPAPRREEVLRSIELDVGRVEAESFPLYFSTPIGVEAMRVAVEDLRSESGAVLAGSRFRVRIQGLAKPELTVGTYWLIDAAEPTSPTFAVEANTTATFWFTFDTQGVEPGEYRGAIRVGEEAVELVARVWDVALPEAEYFESWATFYWNGIGADPRKAKPGGDPGADPGVELDFTVFDRHMDNLAAHHMSYNQDAYWSSFLLNNAVLKEDGTLLTEAIRAGRVTLENLPELDLSVYNPFVDAAIARGMPYYHFQFKNSAKDWLKWAQQITGNKELAGNSPEHLRVKDWLLGQCLGYLRDRGLRRIVAFVADESPPEEIPEILEAAELLQAHGVRTMLTLTGRVGASLEHLRTLREACDVWIWNMTTMQFARRFVSEEPSLLKAGDLQYTYTADWHRAAYVRNRSFGPFCVWNGLDGWFIHGYLRWYPNGGGVFGGPEGPIDTEGWEGARDGVEDGRYLARLFDLCDKLERDPRAEALVRQIRAELPGLIGTDPQAGLWVKDVLHTSRGNEYPYLTPSTDLEGLRTLKGQVLAWLAALEPMDGTLASLHYDGQPWVERGRLAVRIEGPTEAAEALRRGLAERAGVAELEAVPGAAASRVLIGDETDAAIGELVRAGVLGVNDRYPAAGEFVLVTLDGSGQRVNGDRTPASEPRTTVVYARDERGLARGIEQLICLAEVRRR